MRNKAHTYFLTTALLLSLCPGGSRGASIKEHLAGSVVPAKKADAQSPAQVSAEFQAEIARLSAEGLRLKEALEASLDGTSRHLAAIFENGKPKEEFKRHEFRILESDGRTVKTIFRRAEFAFSFGVQGKPDKLNGTDINGDGLKEIIVRSSSGGNCWACNPVEIYQVKNHKADLIAAAPISRISDLNQDGAQELIVTDARWESYDDFSHAAAPGALMIYTWRNGRYVYASRDFPAFYKSEIERLRAAIEQAKADVTADPFSDESYIGGIVSLAITHAHMGNIERGLEEMEALLKSNARTEEQARHRAKILEDFRKGESAARLREMKHGDPMPLG